jgi:hypothetical protein
LDTQLAGLCRQVAAMQRRIVSSMCSWSFQAGRRVAVAWGSTLFQNKFAERRAAATHTVSTALDDLDTDFSSTARGVELLAHR